MLICPECNHEHDPEFRFCTQCGAPLPPPAPSTEPVKEPSGKARGIEPDPETRHLEPSYDGGGAAQMAEDATPIEIPPPYAGVEEPSGNGDLKKKPAPPPPPPKPYIVGMWVIASLVFPLLGVLVSIVWAFNPSYRRAALPALIATLIGGGFWGWVTWVDVRQHMYDDPYSALNQYIEAQDWARETDGHYLSMLELRTRGYLPAGYPEESTVEYEIVEHVLGPTGYVVEVVPGAEETRFYRMDSLWTDHTGDIHRGSIDGPRFEP